MQQPPLAVPPNRLGPGRDVDAASAAFGGAGPRRGPASGSGPGAGTGADAERTKAALRLRLATARRARPTAVRAAASERIRTAALATPEVAAASVVAAYAAYGAEPATAGLLEALRAEGKTILLPVLLPDEDLDWAEYAGPAALSQGDRGLREPGGPRLGVAAVAQADAVLAPGLAVDVTGMRLGRGGGSYDRALARVMADRFTAVLLYDGEVLADVPARPHDQRVTAAITPSGLQRFGPAVLPS